jgi:16S rRNA (adenine1518-N6/adenine1519-N6)-dimethyltransferase
MQNVEGLKNLLRRYNLKPNFTYGQNFLIDDIVLQDIVDAAEITSADKILEIGPGVGNLTRLLCERAGFVLSVEKDPKFLPVLKSIKKDFPNNFRYEIADALEFNFGKAFNEYQTVPEGKAGRKIQRPISVPIRDSSADYKVVANIPYYITGKILQMLLAAKLKPSEIILLTQKEVARNITAKAGDLSVLAISVQLFGKPEIIQIVPAKNFYPAPKVDSAVIKITPYKKSPYVITDEKSFFKILKACFAGKRKQIHNTLVNNLRLEKDTVEKILSETKINPAARPQELTIEKWIGLLNKIDKN